LKKALQNRDDSIRSAFAARLRQAAETHDVAELAAKIGVTPVTLYRWLSGKFDPSLPKLAQLAEAMEVSLAWLVAGLGPIDRRRALRHELLEDYGVPEFEGASEKDDKSPVAFYEPWLFGLLYGSVQNPTLIGAIPTGVPLLIEVREDSMEPTIAQGDLVLVDRTFGVRGAEITRDQIDRRSVHDGIYVFRSRALGSSARQSGGHPVVRRVQYRLDQTMVIRCDNPKYPEETYSLKAANSPRPLGRLLWRAGRI
jgi:transcriptional regulator with XRE-family HTH domain